MTFLALRSACKAVEPYYSILEKEFSSCLSKCLINPQITSSLNSQTQNQPGVLRSSDHKTDFLCPAVIERPLVNNNVVSYNEIFQRAWEILERKNKTNAKKNGGIIIPVSDFKVTVDKSIAYSEARTKLFAKKAQRSRGKVQCDTEIRLVSEKFPTAS